ncbi:MAG TPA: hypothetical protein VL361_25050 [Candidatus Limnocylindrales bacterium]|jgi:hypothetical protein|nr:hypothetical protein [Candidatus Limnocylindrales bacterium]
MTALAGWENFYVIVGSSAGALIGLQFVADTPTGRGDAQASDAFATPSVVHFGVVLFLSALVTAPWTGLTPLAVLWALLGPLGAAYSVIVARRLRIQTVYKPVLEDWLFHALLPLVAYAAIAVSACLAHSHGRLTLFLVAAAVLLLLFIGVHNAWDAVVYHVFVRRRGQTEKDQAGKPKE